MNKIEIANERIETLIEDINSIKLDEASLDVREFRKYEQLGGMLYLDTNLRTKEPQICWTDNGDSMREMFENVNPDKDFDLFIAEVSLEALDLLKQKLIERERKLLYTVIWRNGDETWTFPTREEAQKQIDIFVKEDLQEFGEDTEDDYFIHEDTEA